MQIQLHSWLELDGEQWSRQITYPFPPFPGMLVGARSVKAVLVCQGNLDGRGFAEVELNPCSSESAAMLKNQGFQLES